MSYQKSMGLSLRDHLGRGFGSGRFCLITDTISAQQQCRALIFINHVNEPITKTWNIYF